MAKRRVNVKPITHSPEQEAIRQFRFKTKALGLLLNYCMSKMSPGDRAVVEGALVGLTFHRAEEHPLRFKFNGEQVIEP